MIKKTILIFIAICLTVNIAEAKTKPIINSVGNPDIAKYKTFTVINTSLPNTPEFLRNLPILQNLVFRFQQEGFEFVDNLDKADFATAILFIDAVGQEYVPPRTYTSVSYNPGTTTTSTTGMASGFGNFVNFQATSQSTSTASATASTTTTGGYFVPNYGVALAVNIYDTKTQQLVWSGAGASKANASNIYPALDNIILGIIDDHLITPAYIKGERKKIRKKYEAKSQDEFLKPIAPPEKIGFFQNYKDDTGDIGILCSLNTQGQLLVSTLNLKNNTDKDFIFSPEDLKLKFQNKDLYVFSKSEVASLFFKAGTASMSEADLRENQGLFGALLLYPLEELFGTSSKALMKKRDRAVRFTYEHYLEKHTIAPKEFYTAYVYALPPMTLEEGDKILVLLTIGDRSVEIEFTYEKGWMTFKEYKTKFRKYM